MADKSREHAGVRPPAQTTRRIGNIKCVREWIMQTELLGEESTRATNFTDPCPDKNQSLLKISTEFFFSSVYSEEERHLEQN